MGRLAEVGIDEGWRIEWIPGSWMSHQRCAGWLGGKAEFPCGLEGGCERRSVAGRWKVVSKFGDGFLWCCGGMCGMICISYKIYPFIWFLFCFNV